MGDSNCLGIKHPGLFISILDFIVCLILMITILQMSYISPNRRQEIAGRVIVCLVLFFRFIYTSAVEYYRCNTLKMFFIDGRNAFKLFSISRYLYVSVIMIPIFLTIN